MQPMGIDEGADASAWCDWGVHLVMKIGFGVEAAC
jgi:hypothetical protein